DGRLTGEGGRRIGKSFSFSFTFSFSMLFGSRTSKRTKTILIPAGEEGDGRAVLGDGGGREVAAERDGGHHERAFAEERAGVEHGVAAHLGAVAEDRAEFFQAGVHGAGGQAERDGLLVEAEVGDHRTRAE